MKQFNKKNIIAIAVVVFVLLIIAILGKRTNPKSIANNFDFSIDKNKGDELIL